jgi:hypothetical protein
MIGTQFNGSNYPRVISEYFAPLGEDADRSFIAKSERIERDARIEAHPFFIYAAENRQALAVWASQEAIVTNPFSQVLFRVIGNIKNVHVRSLLLPVVHGEHSVVRKGTAEHSHPWLIWRLCTSLGLTGGDFTPTRAVEEFIGVLERSAEHPMRALGVLGIGNERMLLSEYRAIEACFDLMYPEADYRDFLHANIEEDVAHTRLISDAAVALVSFGHSPEEFVAGAQEGVAARVAYYDTLLEEVRSSSKSN